MHFTHKLINQFHSITSKLFIILFVELHHAYQHQRWTLTCVNCVRVGYRHISDTRYQIRLPSKVSVLQINYYFCSNCKQKRKWKGKEKLPEFANERATSKVEHVKENEDDREDVAVEGKYCGRSITAALIFVVGGSGGRSKMHLILHRRETLLWRWKAAVWSLLCSLYYTQAAYGIDENCKVGKFDLF